MSKHPYYNVGDKVRNIRNTSSRFNLIGFVEKIQRDGKKGDKYLVKWSNGAYGTYFVELAHHSIEAVVDPKAVGQKHVMNLDLSKLEEKTLAAMLEDAKRGTPAYILSGVGATFGYERVQGVHDEIIIHVNKQPKRRVLKKVRRNVISGKTQEDMVREMGNARGVQQFNTRCLGRSTGQALRIIGDAMCNPTTEIRIKDIDHAVSQGIGQRMAVNEHFLQLVKSLIGNMKGFTFTDTHIVFHPIVTEETYVEAH